MKRILKAGTRPSALAVKQAKEIESRLASVKFDIVTIKTPGDRDKLTPLSGFEGTDFFTKDIEIALLSGRVDLAIHSAKDLEEAIPYGLVIAAMTGSISPYDALVSRNNETLETLKAGAVVGTSSDKRKEEVLKYRKDLIVKDIRGDIDERLKKLDSGEYDAVIVAHAALIRLGYENRIAEIIERKIIEPHPLQGRLAIQVRRDRPDLIELFKSLETSDLSVSRDEFRTVSNTSKIQEHT